MEIDATTQIGNVGMGIILNGSGLLLDPNDGILELGPGSDGSLVRGLVVNGSESYGLVVASNGNTIETSFIGTNAFGTLAVPNLNGMLVSGNNNTIGGEAGAAGVVGNLISGNAEAGLQITGASNIVRGNYIGLNADGSAALANTLLGVEVLNGDNNRIGVDDLSGNGRNVISGALELISVIGSDNTRITGNWLGTDATGTDTSLALAPVEAGISISGGVNNRIGLADAGNVIAGADGIGESGVGIRVSGSSANNIVENSIGTDRTGVFDLGHYGAGIILSGTSNANLVSRNLIGFTRVLDPPLTGSGVVVEGGVRNRITENRFRSNGGLAIDLGGDGPTPNDGGAADDADTGPNDLLNKPVVAQATLVGNTMTVTGTIDSNPNDNFLIEVFVREGADDDQDARRFLGAQNLPTPASGETPFTVDFILGPGDVDVGDVVVATAIDGNNDTSELSAGVAVTAGAPPATEFTVNSSGDTSDGTCNAAHCTLREAINAANADPGVETIRFGIGTGAVTISPTSALPLVTQPVVLDATTQPGYSGVPLIRLDGAGAGASTPGLEIQGGGTTVRGFSITNFTWDGVKMEDGDGNTVEDNWLGVRLNGDGVAAAGNGTYGVLADFGSAGNVIRRNLIGGNGFGTGGPFSGIGIWHTAADNIVEDNDVGFGPGLLGGESLPNAIGVIVSETTGTQLSGNTIANSTGAGVWVFGSATSGNTITSNLIHSNGGLGIDLGALGVTANDPFDADTGANDTQNFPVITAVDGEVVQGTLHSKALFEYRLEFFASADCDPSGNGEGARFLGALNGIGTGQTGNAEFSASFPSIAVGEFVTATATDPNGNTSEFSSCFPEPVAVTAEVTIAPQAGSASVTAPARVELEDVPAETFIAAAKSALEPAPLGAIPLGAIPLGAIPLGAIPLGAIGFLDPQIRTLLGGIPLSTVPLTPPKSWSALLETTSLKGLPLQSLSLQQALDALAAQPTGVSAVPLGAIGLKGSVLGSLTPEAIGLGVAPLGAIGIGEKGADEAGDTNLADWCEWLSGPPVNCTNPASLQTESVLSTSLRGAPLGAIPLGAIPLGAIPLGAIPLGAIPLGAIDIEFSPLGAIPLGAIPLGRDPARCDPVGRDPARRDQPAELASRCDPARRHPARCDPDDLHVLSELPDGRRAQGSRRPAPADRDARAADAGRGSDSRGSDRA